VRSGAHVGATLSSACIAKRRRAHVDAFVNTSAPSLRLELDAAVRLSTAVLLGAFVARGEVVCWLQVWSRNVTEVLGVTVGHPGEVSVDRHEPSR
jgi:hypothetical protein